MARFATDFPVLTGETVTQGHADYCQVHGHATHTIRNADNSTEVAPYCPRCGDSLTAPSKLMESLPAIVEAAVTSGIDLETHVNRQGDPTEVVAGSGAKTVDGKMVSFSFRMYLTKSGRASFSGAAHTQGETAYFDTRAQAVAWLQDH